MMVCPNCLAHTLRKDEEVCPSCGWRRGIVDGVLDFLSNEQRKNQTLQDYTDNYEQLAQTNLKKSNIDRTFLARQARNLAEYLGDVRGISACEIGIGQGFLCQELIRLGVDRIAAIDVAISFLKRFVDDPKINVYLANAETLPFENEFDLIVSTNVMEHVLNVGSFLYCINRALVMKGRVAIRVPYREGLLSYSPHTGYDHKFGHLRSFNKDILRINLKQAGFRISAFHLDGFSPQTPRKWAMETRIGRAAVRWLQRYANRNLKHWSDVVDLPKPILLGLLRPVEIVVVAEKVVDLHRKASGAA